MNDVTRSNPVEQLRHGMAPVGDGTLHYVALGSSGTPVLLVHGFPETCRAFWPLMPLLASRHRVFAVDLRGFGGSSRATPSHDGSSFAADLHAMIAHLGAGPVHLVVQDISGFVGHRLGTDHPADLRSIIAIETGLPGFGLEMLADVANGGAWYIGMLATPGGADAFLPGREQQFIVDFILSAATVDFASIPDAVINGIVGDYSLESGWSGAQALYASMLRASPEIRELASRNPLTIPLLAIDRAGSHFTLSSFGAAHSGKSRHETIDGVGHYIAMEAPGKLADILLPFLTNVDNAP